MRIHFIRTVGYPIKEFQSVIELVHSFELPIEVRSVDLEDINTIPVFRVGSK